MKKVGVIVGREWSFPPKFIDEVNRRGKGVVAEFQSGFRSIGVRFNGDPDVIWLRRRELARVPEVS